MRKYKVFKIERSNGNNIGKHSSYSTLASAKRALRNCEYNMDVGSKIVEYEVSEVPISILELDIKVETHTRRYGASEYTYTTGTFLGFKGDPKKDTKQIQIQDKISFNK